MFTWCQHILVRNWIGHGKEATLALSKMCLLACYVQNSKGETEKCGTQVNDKQTAQFHNMRSSGTKVNDTFVTIE